MTKRSTRSTRLQKVMRSFGLKPMQVLREARRQAAAMQRPSISRQHLGRIRAARAVPTEDKIYIIVAAIRS